MSGKAASTLLLHKLPGVAAERVLLVGLGKAGELNSKTISEILSATFSALNKHARQGCRRCISSTKVSARMRPGSSGKPCSPPPNRRSAPTA